ncbi:hypothetical protein EPO05_06465 [Patescibacteria group bacterium]|nr:MAG: hypothetical protein EPO05_06465 [Patescibacteria group bacterium]
MSANRDPIRSERRKSARHTPAEARQLRAVGSDILQYLEHHRNVLVQPFDHTQPDPLIGGLIAARTTKLGDKDLARPFIIASSDTQKLRTLERLEAFRKIPGDHKLVIVRSAESLKSPGQTGGAINEALAGIAVDEKIQTLTFHRSGWLKSMGIAETDDEPDFGDPRKFLQHVKFGMVVLGSCGTRPQSEPKLPPGQASIEGPGASWRPSAVPVNPLEVVQNLARSMHLGRH